MKKVTIVDGSPMNNQRRRVSEFTGFEVQKTNTVKTTQGNNRIGEFYEVDLSGEEERKDKKSAMSLRRKKRKSTKGH